MARGLTAEEAFERINDALDRRIKGMGVGASALLDRLMGHQPGFLRQARNNGTLRLGQTLGYVEHTGGGFGSFFHEAFGPLAEGGEEEPPDGLCPLAAFAKRARLARPKSPCRHLAMRLGALALDAAAGPAITPAQQRRLDEIDALRYQRPKPAVRQANVICRRALDNGRGEQALRAAGVLASALRLCMRLDDAQVVLWVAFQQAEHLCLRRVAADLLQRMVYVVYDRGHYEQGLGLANEAQSRYATLADRVRAAQALVDRGIMLFHLGDFTLALEALEAALRDLPASERGNRCTALQMCAFSHLGLGARREAARCLRQAAGYLPAGAHYRGRLLWLRAALAAHSDDANAERRYRQAIAIFGQTYPADVAVCSIELIHHLLRCGREAEAEELAAQMRALAMTLPDGTVVQQAVWKLVRLRALTPRRVHNILEQAGSARSCLIKLEQVAGPGAAPRG